MKKLALALTLTVMSTAALADTYWSLNSSELIEHVEQQDTWWKQMWNGSKKTYDHEIRAYDTQVECLAGVVQAERGGKIPGLTYRCVPHWIPDEPR
jgi:hypothetical protein